jgi:hypothetical protein
VCIFSQSSSLFGRRICERVHSQFNKSSRLSYDFYSCVDILTGTFSASLSLLNVGMLDCVSMDVTLPYQIVWGNQFRVFEPRLPVVDGSSDVADSLEQSLYVSSPLSTDCRESLQAGSRLFVQLIFSQKSFSFCSLPVSPRWMNMVLPGFHQTAA